MYRLVVILLVAMCATGCATQYRTPGAGLSYAEFAGEIQDVDIRQFFEREAASPLPANLAIVRVQDSGYSSYTSTGYGHGRYSIVTTRDIETDEHIKSIEELPLVLGVAPLGRLLVPANANTIKDLRLPAAQLRADMLLIYSVDTSFSVAGKSLGPLELITLGLIPNKKAHVTATVAGALVDVRTGFIYGTTEASALEQQSATVWSTTDAIDASRLKAEKRAFDDFVGEFHSLWANVANSYVAGEYRSKQQPAEAGSAAPTPEGDRYYSVTLED